MLDDTNIRTAEISAQIARIAIVIMATAAYTGFVAAKLPPVTEDAKAKAAEVAAKSAWTDKVGLFQLCRAMDRTAEAYRKEFQAAGKEPPQPTATPPCIDPGPFVTPVTPVASKPLEASGAHSPPGAAISPPSTNATAAEIAGKR